MPWLSIILALLSYFISKKSGASDSKALLTAGLAGAGSYYVTHETDWGKANLGSLDGVVTGTGTTLKTGEGTEVTDPATGAVIKTAVPVPGTTTSSAGGTGVTDVLKSWGATGTAAVIGTTALATNSDLQKWILPAAIFGGLLLLMR